MVSTFVGCIADNGNCWSSVRETDSDGIELIGFILSGEIEKLVRAPLDKSWFSVADGKLKIKSEVKKYSEKSLRVGGTKLKILEFEIYYDRTKTITWASKIFQ